MTLHQWKIASENLPSVCNSQCIIASYEWTKGGGLELKTEILKRLKYWICKNAKVGKFKIESIWILKRKRERFAKNKMFGYGKVKKLKCTKWRYGYFFLKKEKGRTRENERVCCA